jgi:hypothetical protein
VRKIATPVVMLGLALVLMGAEVAAVAAADGAGPDTITQGQMTLKLTSTMPGVTFNGDTLVCPPALITVSSGDSPAGCEFTISSTGAVAPSSVTVTMAVSGMSPAQANADEFAIVPRPGTLVHFQTASQTIYSFTGTDLPVTINPGLAWGLNAGGVALDNSDLGAAFVVTYTVVAESLEGVTATPVASGSEVVEGATGVPGGTSTPPPTASSSDYSSGGNGSPLFALLISFLLGALGLGAVAYQRRSVRR